MALLLEELGKGSAVPHVVHRQLARPLRVAVARLYGVVAKVDGLVAGVEGEGSGAKSGKSWHNLISSREFKNIFHIRQQKVSL